MSRCYPFPPPGFVPNEIRDESLIESIKKGTKEEVKREKKDIKHNKDKKRKERDNEPDRSKKHRHKRRRKDDNANASKKERENESERSKKHRHKRQRKDDSTNASKKVDDGRELIINNELECLDKSCLTVELEHQTSSQNSCDSTLHTNENERLDHIQSQPLDGRHNDSETSIRILLHGKGQIYPEDEVMMTNKDQKHCSSPESLEASQTPPGESVGHPYSDKAPLDALRVCQEKIRDTTFDPAIDNSTKLSKEKKTLPLKDVKSRETNRQTSMQLGKEKPSSSHQEGTGPSKLCSRCPPSTAVRFSNLIENWAPDRVKVTDSEDQEWWLFMKVGAKRHHQVSNQTTSNESGSMVWPTARFLPEAELHVLPFTVPF